jgi:hypothetical protein
VGAAAAAADQVAADRVAVDREREEALVALLVVVGLLVVDRVVVVVEVPAVEQAEAVLPSPFNHRSTETCLPVQSFP